MFLQAVFLDSFFYLKNILSKVHQFVKNINLFIIYVIVIIPTGCSDNNTKNQLIAAESIVTHSKYLKINETGDGVLIKITHPTVKNKIYNYFVAKNKEKKTPNGYLRIDREDMSFLIFSTTHVGMLEKLNQVSKIKGTCSKELIHSSSILKKIDNGFVQSFEDEGLASLEKIIKLKPRIIVYSGSSSEFNKASLLEKMNIFTIPNFDWKETHPLGKAEWILFFGYLTGSENLAKQHLKRVKDNYFSLVEKVKGLKTSPSVLMGSKIGDFWYGPAGESYGAKLLNDAKANYVYKKTRGTASVEYSMEKVFSEAKNVEFWINPGFSSLKLLEMNNPKAKFFNSFQNKKIYCYSNNQNKYWELNGVQPDWILSDLIQIFHPNLKLENPMYFYKAVE